MSAMKQYEHGAKSLGSSLRSVIRHRRRRPAVIVTDKLNSYGAAKRDILPNVEHRQHKGLNNRAENSHQATRIRERRMRRFKSPGHAQRFLASFDLIRQHFHPKQHLLPEERISTINPPTF